MKLNRKKREKLTKEINLKQKKILTKITRWSCRCHKLCESNVDCRAKCYTKYHISTVRCWFDHHLCASWCETGKLQKQLQSPLDPNWVFFNNVLKFPFQFKNYRVRLWVVVTSLWVESVNDRLPLLSKLRELFSSNQQPLSMVIKNEYVHSMVTNHPCE